MRAAGLSPDGGCFRIKSKRSRRRPGQTEGLGVAAAPRRVQRCPSVVSTLNCSFKVHHFGGGGVVYALGAMIIAENTMTVTLRANAFSSNTARGGGEVEATLL